MDLTEARKKLLSLQAKQSAYQHAMGLIYYDGATTAPKGTAANRAHSLGILSEEIYKLSTSEETLDLLTQLDEAKKELSEKEQRMVYLLLKELKENQKIPMDEFIAFQQLLVESDDVWHTAKEKSDFVLFEPYLTKIFDTTKRFALYIEPEKDPYDHQLSAFEDGLDQKTCDAFFAAIRSRLVPLMKQVTAKPQPEDTFLWGDFPDAKQEELSLYLMNQMGLDLRHVGLSTTEHPFTTSLGSHFDERITTHYLRDNFASSMYSVIHEGGHALYDTGSADDLAYTVLDGGVSMGIHESQSRFYENILGRSRAFTAFLLPKLKELFPEMKEVSEDAFFRSVNRVQPSLIRTEADEVTYSLHVMVRYELEKAIFSGALSVHDLPGEWNHLYKETLGIEVPSDREGVLQDSHWSGGGIGYFPSYALGSAYGAQFLKKMKQTVNVEQCLLKGDFAPINAWNRENIWQYGSLKRPSQLLTDVLGEPFDPMVYTDYLEEKCKDVYRL